MSEIWHKVWRDLTLKGSRLRTLLVVLSTAVGLFALGLVFGLSGVMRARLTEDYQATVPAHITFWGGPLDQTVIGAVRREPSVADVEFELESTIYWKLEGETNWREGDLVARTDYTGQRINRIELLQGRWPSERALVVQSQTSQYFHVPLGATIVVKLEQIERRLPVEGIVRVPTAFPPQFGGNAIFYTPLETVPWLTGQQENSGKLTVRLKSFSMAGTIETADRIKDRLQRMGLSVGNPDITAPDVHFLQSQMDTMFLILGILGGLSLGLSAFLIVNTMNAIIVQQVRQIGVMKVMGATFWQVMRVYLMAALIYGLSALLLAVPLAAAAAYLLEGLILSMVNVESRGFQVALNALVIQVVAGVAVPLLAALTPVISGVRISPHQAISNYGLGGGFGDGRLDRWVGRVRYLPCSLALSLRNVFRRKARALLTLLALVFGGVVFITVMSVSSSLRNTIEVQLGDAGFDISVTFGRLYNAARLVDVAKGVPGVDGAEAWDRRWATLALSNREDYSIVLWGIPPNSVMFKQNVISGRGLLPDDGRAILLNRQIAADKGIHVGDAVELTIGDLKSVWTVVGLSPSTINNQRDNFVPFDTLTRETGDVEQSSRVVVLSEKHDAASQKTLVRDLRNAYTAHNLKTSSFQSAGAIREQNQAQFNVITYLLLAMAILAGIVGSLGLMGAISINVVERGREIGIMRAIGATSSTVAGIFVGEGVLLGVLSWLLSLPLSYPGAQVFSGLVGGALMHLPLDFRYSVGGALLWLLIVVVLSALASLWPALRAAQLSVHEALAYE